MITIFVDFDQFSIFGLKYFFNHNIDPQVYQKDNFLKKNLEQRIFVDFVGCLLTLLTKFS
jgi:hypothetical protein